MVHDAVAMFAKIGTEVVRLLVGTVLKQLQRGIDLSFSKQSTRLLQAPG